MEKNPFMIPQVDLFSFVFWKSLKTPKTLEPSCMIFQERTGTILKKSLNMDLSIDKSLLKLQVPENVKKAT